MTTIIGTRMRLAKMTKYCLGDDVWQISLNEVQYHRILKAEGRTLVQSGKEYKIVSLVPFMMTLVEVIK